MWKLFRQLSVDNVCVWMLVGALIMVAIYMFSPSISGYSFPSKLQGQPLEGLTDEEKKQQEQEQEQEQEQDPEKDAAAIAEAEKKEKETNETKLPVEGFSCLQGSALKEERIQVRF